MPRATLGVFALRKVAAGAEGTEAEGGSDVMFSVFRVDLFGWTRMGRFGSNERANLNHPGICFGRSLTGPNQAQGLLLVRFTLRTD